MRTWNEYWDQATSFKDYVEHAGRHAQRWDYIYRVSKLNERQKDVLSLFARPMRLLTLSGVWCGDCIAQVPLIQRIAESSGLIEHRILDADKAEADFLDRYQINGGRRVPVVFFLSEDFYLVWYWGDRTLGRYHLLRQIRQSLGPSASPDDYYRHIACHSANQDTIELTMDELLSEIERAEMVLQLSPRLSKLDPPIKLAATV